MCDNQEYLLTLLNVPWGTKSPLVEDHGLDVSRGFFFCSDFHRLESREGAGGLWPNPHGRGYPGSESGKISTLVKETDPCPIF